MRMRNFGTAVLITALCASTALAAPGGALAPGKPAGVRQAQEENGHTMLIIAGVTLVGVGIGLAVSGNGNNASPTPTTSAPTGTTP
jgi:hypothetical protein